MFYFLCSWSSWVERQEWMGREKQNHFCFSLTDIEMFIQTFIIKNFSDSLLRFWCYKFIHYLFLTQYFMASPTFLLAFRCLAFESKPKFAHTHNFLPHSSTQLCFPSDRLCVHGASICTPREELNEIYVMLSMEKIHKARFHYVHEL